MFRARGIGLQQSLNPHHKDCLHILPPKALEQLTPPACQGRSPAGGCVSACVSCQLWRHQFSVTACISFLHHSDLGQSSSNVITLVQCSTAPSPAHLLVCHRLFQPLNSGHQSIHLAYCRLLAHLHSYTSSITSMGVNASGTHLTFEPTMYISLGVAVAQQWLRC